MISNSTKLVRLKFFDWIYESDNSKLASGLNQLPAIY